MRSNPKLQLPDGPLALAELPGPMSYEAFLDWTDGTHAEWVDGEVLLMSPASFPHQDLVLFLAAVLRSYVEFHKLGRVCPAPFQMRLGHSGREPDVIFIGNESLGRLRLNRIDGPADLAIEIVSPESRERDEVEKLAEYEKAGVREYWIIDPENRTADFHQLGPNGRYRALSPGTGRYESVVIPGCWIDIAWLWSDPIPQIPTILKIWGIV